MTGNNNKKIKFGTDGIRGVANQELSPDLAMLVGKCAANELCSVTGATGRVLVAKDTRVSGDMIEAAIVAGVLSTGADAWRIGIAPTPALAYLTKTLNCDCGIMISASHNPVEDNGIKIFSGEGYKLEDQTECSIENVMNNRGEGVKIAGGDQVGCSLNKSNVANTYVSFIRHMLRGVFFDKPIVIDCAYGAASKYAKRVFKEVSNDVILMHADEDGYKINVDCGSTRPEALMERVVKEKAALGFAFDGDGDRVLFVDEKGKLVDGDSIMLICARALKKENKLAGNMVVSTVMSNMGFEKELEKEGMEMLRAPVGDKYVLREMQAGNYVLGGEQSGHVIFLTESTTGDGLLTAAQMLRTVCAEKAPLSKQAAFEHSAQFLKNVKVPDRDAFYENKKIQKKVREVEAALGEEGRVVVRPSGTEPLIRVMVEAWDKETAESNTDAIIEVVKKEFGL